MQDVINQIDRLKKIYDVKTDVALSDKLGKDKNTVSVWKRRGSIPLEVMKRVSDAESVSFDWISSGKGSMQITSKGELLNTAEMLGGLFSDERSIKIVQLLPFAPKDFLDQVIDRLEEFKKLSKL